jgi:hypothetical protein
VIDTRYVRTRTFHSESLYYKLLRLRRSSTNAAIWVTPTTSTSTAEHCTCCRSDTRYTTDCVRTGPVPKIYKFTAATTSLFSRRATDPASRAQTSEPRAGFWMGPSTYRTDAVAGGSSADDKLAPSVLLHSHHASFLTVQRLQCAPGEPLAPLVVTLGVVAPVAGPGTLGMAPGGRPGPGGGSGGLIPAQPEMHPAGLTTAWDRGGNSFGRWATHGDGASRACRALTVSFSLAFTTSATRQLHQNDSALRCQHARRRAVSQRELQPRCSQQGAWRAPPPPDAEQSCWSKPVNAVVRA